MHIKMIIKISRFRTFSIRLYQHICACDAVLQLFFRLRLPLAACGKQCGSIRHVLLIYYANAFNCIALCVSTNALTHVFAIKTTTFASIYVCVYVYVYMYMCASNAHMRHALLQCALMQLVIILQLLAYVCGMQSA